MMLNLTVLYSALHHFMNFFYKFKQAFLVCLGSIGVIVYLSLPLALPTLILFLVFYCLIKLYVKPSSTIKRLESTGKPKNPFLIISSMIGLVIHFCWIIQLEAQYSAKYPQHCLDFRSSVHTVFNPNFSISTKLVKIYIRGISTCTWLPADGSSSQLKLQLTSTSPLFYFICSILQQVGFWMFM